MTRLRCSAILCTVTLVLLGTAPSLRAAQDADDATRPEDAQQQQSEADSFLQSFADAKPVRATVRARLDDLIAAARADEEEAFRACVDEEELLERALAISGIEVETLERRAIREAVITPLLQELSVTLRDRVGATGTELRLEQEAQDGSIFVVLRTRSDADLLDRYARFCLRGEGMPRIVDFELESSSLWASEQVSLGYAAATANDAAKLVLTRYADALQAAMAMYAEGNGEEALAALADLREDAERLGAQTPVGYWRSVMEVAFDSGRRDVADLAAERLVALRPASPLPRFYRGRMALDEGHYAAARVHLSNYQRLVGLDAQALAMIGDCYEEEGRLDAAQRYWRAALDQNADLTHSLFSLGIHLDVVGADELVSRFRAATRPLVHFESLLNAWSGRGACDAVAVLSEARREDEPRDANAYYYEASCALQAGEFERARELALRGRELAPEDERHSYDVIWLEAAWSTGDPLDAYRDAPDKAFAFDHIGEQLVFGAGDLEQLLALIELRRADDDQDVWIPYYQGHAFHAQGMYREADDQFRIGYTHALESEDADRAAAYRLARTDNAYAGGSAVQAYQQMPEEDVYRRLLQLTLADRDGDTLAELLVLRRERVPDDLHVPFWIAHAQVVSGQEAEGLQRLMAKRADFARDPELAPWLESDLVRGNLRLGRLDLAQQFAEASTRRDGNPIFEFLVHVARGNADAAETVFRELRDLGYPAARIYEDRDVGDRLREDPAFSTFRATWPPPKQGS